jgi:hypothetical protein
MSVSDRPWVRASIAIQDEDTFHERHIAEEKKQEEEENEKHHIGWMKLTRQPWLQPVGRPAEASIEIEEESLCWHELNRHLSKRIDNDSLGIVWSMLYDDCSYPCLTVLKILVQYRKHKPSLPMLQRAVELNNKAAMLFILNHPQSYDALKMAFIEKASELGQHHVVDTLILDNFLGKVKMPRHHFMTSVTLAKIGKELLFKLLTYPHNCWNNSDNAIYKGTATNLNELTFDIAMYVQQWIGRKNIFYSDVNAFFNYFPFMGRCAYHSSEREIYHALYNELLDIFHNALILERKRLKITFGKGIGK